MELTTAQRRDLRARAHSLHPVVSISQQGLSETVLAEIDRSLKAHELIKVRVYGAERDARDALMTDICTRLEAAPVQHIGNLLVIFRTYPEGKKAAPRMAPKAAIKTGTKARIKPGTAKFSKSSKSVRSAKPSKPTDPRRRSRI